MGLIKKGHSFLRQCISDPNYLDKYLFCHLFDYSFSEYERYHFFDKNVNRLSFISFKESNKIIQKYNKVQTNKKENYERFHEYFGRDCCLLNLSKEENRKKLYSFIQKHKRFVVKKYDGSSGVGIKIIETEESQEWINDFLDEYQDGCLLEEIIKQSKDIANIYPLSVNTLRITTVNYGNCIEAIYPVMRFGMGNQFTDNKSKFCLFCAINEETKEIINVVDWQGRSFDIHPDTKKKIIGFKVPELHGAIRTAKNLADYFPENVFLGFDFAHTEKGWILVEVNTATNFNIWQLPYQKGFRRELFKILHKKY